MYSRLRSGEKLKDELVLAMLDRNPRTAALARATQRCLQMQSPPLGSVETRSHTRSAAAQTFPDSGPQIIYLTGP